MKFITINIKNKMVGKTIKIISLSMFSVYIIHEQSEGKTFIWQTIFKIKEYASSSTLIPRILASSVIVFVISLGIDLIFRGLYRMLKIIQPINRIIKKIDEKVEKVNEKLQDFLVNEEEEKMQKKI